MKTVTSISGGRSSAYMALHYYPTDYYIFACVLTDHKPSAPKDPGLLRRCKERIPHFTASLEADSTLKNMLEIEQLLGKPVKWVASEFTLDQFILGTTDVPGYRTGKMMLPTPDRRFCTTRQKIMPIFWHCYLNILKNDREPVLSNIGLRYDEKNELRSGLARIVK